MLVEWSVSNSYCVPTNKCDVNTFKLIPITWWCQSELQWLSVNYCVGLHIIIYYTCTSFAHGLFFLVTSASIKTHSYEDRPGQQESHHQVKFYQMLYSYLHGVIDSEELNKRTKVLCLYLEITKIKLYSKEVHILCKLLAHGWARGENLAKNGLIKLKLLAKTVVV